MNADLKRYIEKLYEKIENEELRRRRLLEALLLGSMGITLVVLTLVFWLDRRGLAGPESPTTIYASGLLFLISSLILYALLQRLPANWSGILFVLLVSGVVLSMEEVPYLIEGRSTYLWILPIILSSVLIHSWASFVTATLVSGIYAFLQVGVLREPVPNPATLASFYFVAFTMWLATSSLERALHELIRINRQLDQRVEERTQALQALNQELMRRNEDLEAFAHTVAHDLKGPLSSLLGFSEALQDNLNDMTQETLVNYLSLIGRSARKLTNIVDELLLLSSFSKVEVLTRPVAMEPVVKAALERLHDTIEQRQAKLTVQDTWPLAYGYAPWLEEVWVNYISNALKYGGDPPEIILGAHREADGIVRFWIKDNGPGLTEEQQRRLFVPFSRIANVRAQGYGLGLSITRRIVERLGGRVGVESQPGAGSTFYFTLPAAPKETTSTMAQAQAASSQTM